MGRFLGLLEYNLNPLQYCAIWPKENGLLIEEYLRISLACENLKGNYCFILLFRDRRRCPWHALGVALNSGLLIVFEIILKY